MKQSSLGLKNLKINLNFFLMKEILFCSQDGMG